MIKAIKLHFVFPKHTRNKAKKMPRVAALDTPSSSSTSCTCASVVVISCCAVAVSRTVLDGGGGGVGLGAEINSVNKVTS